MNLDFRCFDHPNQLDESASNGRFWVQSLRG